MSGQNSSLPRMEHSALRCVRSRTATDRKGGHDSYLLDEDPFAGGDGYAADLVRSGCGAEKRGWKTRSATARGITAVIFDRSRNIGRISVFIRNRSHRTVRGQVELFPLTARIRRGEQEPEPRRGQIGGSPEYCALSALSLIHI